MFGILNGCCTIDGLEEVHALEVDPAIDELIGEVPLNLYPVANEAEVKDGVKTTILSSREGPKRKAPDVPPGWVAKWSKTKQEYYYVNLTNKTSQWTLPDSAYESVTSKLDARVNDLVAEKGK